MTKYTYNKEIFFDENELSYYLLGAFMTDGCIQRNGLNSWQSSLSSKDEDWLQNITNIICPELKICQGNKVKVIHICSKEIGEWFISKGCVPNKSLIIKYPNIPEQYSLDFLRGCFDGDGSLTLYKNKGKLSTRSYFVSISYDFAKSIHEQLLKLGIKNSLNTVIKKPTKINNRIIKQKHPQYRVNLGNNSTCKLLQLIYYPDHKLSLPRKMNLAKTIIQHYSQNLL